MGIRKRLLPFSQKNKQSDDGIILTGTESIALNDNKTNKNTFVIGGAGTGKTRHYAMPNIMQMNSSYVVSDSHGLILTKVGKLLVEKGNYKIKNFDLCNYKKSMHYNPFAYIHSDKDIFTLINAIINNTQCTSSETNDFLNTVDITDLAAIIQNGKGEEDSYTPEEKEIIDKAGETVPINNENNSDVTNSNANTPVNNPDSSEGGESGDSGSALYIVVAVIGVAVIGFAAYKKIGPGKKKKADFDEVEDDEEEVVNDYVVDDDVVDDVVTSDYEDEAEELWDSDDM